MKEKIRQLCDKYLWINIIRQMILEFYLPLMISIAWTVINKNSKPITEQLQTGIVNFFASAWIFSQWNRVKKQIKTERGLNDVGNDIKELVKKLEKQTEHLLGLTFGTDSFCEVILQPIALIPARAIFLRHHGQYPVQDISIEILDRHRFLRNLYSLAPSSDKEIAHYKSLLPGDVKFLPLSSNLERNKVGEIRVDINISTRGGDYRQTIVGAPYESGFVYATKITKGDSVILRTMDKRFPLSEEGHIDWNGDYKNIDIKERKTQD